MLLHPLKTQIAFQSFFVEEDCRKAVLAGGSHGMRIQSGYTDDVRTKGELGQPEEMKGRGGLQGAALCKPNMGKCPT